MKKLIFLLLICALVFPGMAVSAESDLSKGVSGTDVEALQSRLIELGYLEGRADGLFGSQTQAALIAFQQRAGLEETGTGTPQTLSALYAEDAPSLPRTIGMGDKSELVQKLQASLIRLGFLKGDADGAYGKQTAQAVTALQKRMIEQGLPGIKASGSADPATQEALFAQGYTGYLRDVLPGEDSSEVERLQSRLEALNYMDAEIDGNFGEYSQTALRAFQKTVGLAQTGTADEDTFARLFDEGAPIASRPALRPLEKGARSKAVRQLQERLLTLGLMAGLPDDEYGSQMASGLKRLASHLSGAELNWAEALHNAEHLSTELQEHVLDDEIPVYVSEVSLDTKGEQALRVQRRLHTLYYLGASGIDGHFGKTSESALKAFQESNGLPADGIAGEATQTVLFSPEAAHNKTPHLLQISVDKQKVYAYQLDEAGEYQLAREMICSTGLNATPTPRGIFLRTGPQDRWHYFTKYVCWAQYTYIIDGDIMFHSVLYSAKSERTLRYSSVYNLGHKASHGCVRLSVEDAQWIFENCAKGTVVIVDD